MNIGIRRNLPSCKQKPTAEPCLKTLTKIDLAEPAEPFATYSAQTCNYMEKFRKSVGGRFRRFCCNASRQSLLDKVPLVPLCPSAMEGQCGAA
jgi:FPC/CPF motif-containing protein YcgG